MSMNCDGAGEEKEQEHGGKVLRVWSDHGVGVFVGCSVGHLASPDLLFTTFFF